MRNRVPQPYCGGAGTTWQRSLGGYGIEDDWTGSVPSRITLGIDPDSDTDTDPDFDFDFDFDFDNDRTDWDTVPQSEPQMDTDGHRSEKTSVWICVNLWLKNGFLATGGGSPSEWLWEKVNGEAGSGSVSLLVSVLRGGGMGLGHGEPGRANVLFGC
ncbi:MAG: hypothetical protein PHC78_07625 [Verrucomicrobiota bacterium]|nr:hypothetical protein [Verrucomicrobiota bacterium]